MTEHTPSPSYVWQKNRVNEMVEILMKNKAGWTFKAVHNPKGAGYSYINCYDKTGKFIQEF